MRFVCGLRNVTGITAALMSGFFSSSEPDAHDALCKSSLFDMIQPASEFAGRLLMHTTLVGI
jgi:hypothetical protein